MFVRTGAWVVLLCATGSAWAGDKPLYQPAPAWIVPAPEPTGARPATGPTTVLLDHQQRVADGQTWAYTDQAVRVVSTQMMNEVGTVTLPWQPDDGDLIVHRAEIMRGAERIDLLAKGQRFEVLRREEQLERLQMNGTLTATMAVEGLRVGDVLRMTYSVTNKDRALQGNVQTMLPLISAPMKVDYARARISWPTGSDLKWRTYAEGLAPKVVQRGGFDEIEVALPLAKPAEMPSDAPARYRRPPLLEATSFSGWQAVSKVMAPLYRTEGLIAAGSPLEAEATKIMAKSADPRVRTALALQLVQDEVRYLFQAMDGGNYIPQAPADTWSRRYGDCKAKSLLLLAILHRMGIEAEPVLAHIEMGDLVPQRLPSAGAFNHVVIRATVAGKTLWLDGTSGGSRLADLDDTPMFGHVLPVRAAGADLLKIDLRAPGRPSLVVDFELDERAGLGLPAPFKSRVEIRGPMAAMLQAVSSQADKDQIDTFAQMMVNQAFGDGLISERTLSYDADAAMATLTIGGITGTQWKFEDGRQRVVLDKTVQSIDFQPDRARPAWRDIPVMTMRPEGSGVLRLRIRLPEEAGVTLEGDQVLPTTLAGTPVSRTTRLADGWLTVEDRISSDGREIAPGDLGAARSQMALARTRLLTAVAKEGYPSRWRLVQQARKNNGFAAIMAEYAKAIADEPEKANGYVNRASFLAGVWDNRGAVADLGKAIDIEPTADLYFRRAALYRGLGEDAAALKDAEAGLELDPGSARGMAQQADFKFRTGDREAALALLAERIDAGGTDKLGFTMQRAYMLGDAGRVNEGVAMLDEAIRTNPGNAVLLNSRCWLMGTRNVSLDIALKDCTRGIEIAENPSSIFDSRAMVYFRMGRMEEALADLNTALTASPGQSASLFLRGVVRTRAGDKKGAAEDLAGARLMSPMIDKEYGDYGIKP